MASQDQSARSVSVVVPTFNRAGVLRESIDALARQDYPNYEVLYVDDGSTDDTPRVLAAAASAVVRGIRIENCGPGPARNAGAREASGELLLFTDDDVTMAPDWIRRIVVRFARGDCDALCGRIDPQSLETPAERYSHWRMRIQFGDEPKTVRAAPMMSFLISRAVFLELGGFLDESLQAAEDWEFCMRLAQAGRVLLYEPSIAVCHRYPSTVDALARRMRASGALGVYVWHKQNGSATLYTAYATLRSLLCPLWALWRFPLGLYGLALRMEWVFSKARIGAWARLIAGRQIPLRY